MKKKSILLAYLCLSSSFLLHHPLQASALVEPLKNTPDFLRKSVQFTNLFSAVPAVDSESFDPPKHPKALRGTWEAYRSDLVEQFLSGEIRLLDPALLKRDISWENLSTVDKEGVPAVSLMYDQKKALMLEQGIITEEQARGKWEDLSPEQQKSIPTEWLLPSREGMAECRGVGCGQFNREQLHEVIKFITDHDNIDRAQQLSQGKGELISFKEALRTIMVIRARGAIGTSIMIVDHREEPHLHVDVQRAVANGPSGLEFSDEKNSLSMSFYSPGDAFSKGLSNLEAEVIEGQLIQKVQQHDVVTLSRIVEKNHGLIQKSEAQTYKINSAYSERDLAHELGLGYGRVPITDHNAIEGEDGDYLRIAFDLQPKRTYVIHHCRGGRGRTETGLTTRDMMSNSDKNLSLIDFTLRHLLIGGANLLGPLVVSPEKQWKNPQAYERAKEISNFYDYTRESQQGIRILYRDWIKTKLSGKNKNQR